jgi:hypothetical protein
MDYLYAKDNYNMITQKNINIKSSRDVLLKNWPQLIKVKFAFHIMSHIITKNNCQRSNKWNPHYSLDSLYNKNGPNSLDFEKIILPTIRLLLLVPVGSQKYRKIFIFSYFHISTCGGQIWLNHFWDDSHLDYITKLEKESLIETTRLHNHRTNNQINL